jgi:hypothetical protein
MNTTIVFILLLILLYFIYLYDFYRFLLIHINDIDDYIYDYQKLQKKCNSKIILSLTTTPKRIKNIEPVLKSLLDQTIKVDQIALNLPLKPNCGKEYNIPKNYEKICNIFRCGKDYGSGTKFIPTLLREGDINTIIILLDDDYIYGKDFIEKLVDKSLNNQTKCIQSDHAILVKPEHIDVDILKSYKKNIDDEWIKKYIRTDIINLPYDKNFRNLYT